MITLLKVEILGAWIALSIIHGIYDGIFFALANWKTLPFVRQKIKVHPHTIATLLRIVVCATLLFLSGYELKQMALLALSLACIFSFWHNGFYFTTRHLIDVPKYHFFGRSETSTGFSVTLFKKKIQPFELGPKRRTILFIFGLYLLYIL